MFYVLSLRHMTNIYAVAELVPHICSVILSIVSMQHWTVPRALLMFLVVWVRKEDPMGLQRKKSQGVKSDDLVGQRSKAWSSSPTHSTQSRDSDVHHSPIADLECSSEGVPRLIGTQNPRNQQPVAETITKLFSCLASIMGDIERYWIRAATWCTQYNLMSLRLFSYITHICTCNTFFLHIAVWKWMNVL